MDSFAVELDRRAAGRDAGDADRPRRARRGARARRRHDHLRARLRDRLEARAGPADRCRWLSWPRELLARRGRVGRRRRASATSCSAGRSLDLDIACPSPSAPRARTRARARGAVFPLSERHGAWRVALDEGRTVDFTPLQGGSIEADLAHARLHDQRDRRPARRRRADRPVRRPRRSRARRRPRAVSAARLRRRPAAPAARRAARGRARLPARRRDRGARSREGASLVDAAGGRARSSTSCAGSRPRATSASTSSACSSRSAAALDAAAARASTRRSTGSSRHFGERLRAAADLERAPPRSRDTLLRAERAGGRLAARDPPLPPGDRAVGARGAGVPRRAGEHADAVERARASTSRPSRSCAATSSAFPPGPEVGRLLELDRRGARSGHDLDARGGAGACPTIAGRRDRRRGSPSSRSAAARDLTEHVRRFVQPSGDERALDAGTGTGALAFALSPHVARGGRRRPRARAARGGAAAGGSVPERHLRRGRRDATRARRPARSTSPAARGRSTTSGGPELAIAELARVTRPGGHVLVIDQIAPGDPLRRRRARPLRARARHVAHAAARRTSMCARCWRRTAWSCVRTEFDEEPRDLDRYLDLAGCEGEARERAERARADDYSAARRLVSRRQAASRAYVSWPPWTART